MKTVKAYSVFVAFLPIIAIYASGIPGLNLGDFILLLFLIWTCIIIKVREPFNSNRNVMSFLILILYIIIADCITCIMEGAFIPVDDIMIRTVRFSFYIICAIFVSRWHFDYRLASSVVTKVSIAGTVFMIIQYILYFGYDYILKGFLSFVPIYLTDYANQNYQLMYSSFFYRPTSFFLEPALFCQYATIGLVFILFKNNAVTKKKIFGSLFITLGIILSTSIQGLIFATVIWLVYVVKAQKTDKHGNVLFIVLIILLPIAFYELYNSQIVQNTLSRIAIDSNSGAFFARFGGFSSFLNIPDNMKLTGMGYGNVPENSWLSSGAYMLYGAGIIGFIITCFLFVRYFIKSSLLITKLTCAIFFVMLFEAFIFNSYMFVYYFSFIFYTFKEGRSTDQSGFMLKQQTDSYKMRELSLGKLFYE